MKKRLGFIGNSSSCNFILRSWLNCKIPRHIIIPDSETFQLKNLFENNTGTEFAKIYSPFKGELILETKNKCISAGIKLIESWDRDAISEEDYKCLELTINLLADTTTPEDFEDEDESVYITRNGICTKSMIEYSEKYLKTIFRILNYKVDKPIRIKFKQDFEEDGSGGWGGDPMGPGSEFDGDEFTARLFLDKRARIEFDGEKIIYPEEWNKRGEGYNYLNK